MLKEHNREAYEATKAMLLEYRECCLVAATGIGKSNITTELIQELDINALIIVPKISIKDNWDSMPNEYGIYPKFSTVTYQFFSKHYKQLYGFDAYIFDECHHAGSPVWGRAIKEFRENLDTEFVLGLTADPNRYSDLDVKNRNVIDTVFNGHAVYGHDQKSAVEAGILPKASYICAIYDTEGLFKEYSKKDMSDELRGRLDYTRNNCEAIEDIIRRHVPKDVPTKGIVFVDSINNIDIGIHLARKSFPKESIQCIHSGLNSVENAEILRMFKTSKSGFIVAVDMLNEGLHIEGINTIIMLRKTSSPTVYTQQIGRGLAAHGKDITIFDLVRNDISIKNVLSRIHEIEEFKENTEEESKENRIGGRLIKISDQSIIKDYATDILKVLEEIDEYDSFKNGKYRRWTAEEDQIIKEYYPIIGLNVNTMLYNRSSNACTARAFKLGISSYNKQWTAEEDRILQENYPTMGQEVYKLLPNRTASQCCYRAYVLNILRDKNNWTDDEINIIKMYYPSKGISICEMLNNRSKSSIISKANQLGLRRVSKWSKDEDDILRQYYPTMGSNVYKMLPRRNKDTCLQRANTLGISYNKIQTKWSKDEDDILRQYYPTLGTGVCKMLPGRSKESCQGRAKKLKLHKIKK